VLALLVLIERNVPVIAILLRPVTGACMQHHARCFNVTCRCIADVSHSVPNAADGDDDAVVAIYEISFIFYRHL